METHQSRRTEYDSASGCLLRVFWMMIGNVLLVFCAYAIFQNRQSLLGIPDAFYWATVGSLLGARYVDIRYFKGMTAEGKPASIADWRRYAAFLLVVSLALWLSVHAAGHVWLPPT